MIRITEKIRTRANEWKNQIRTEAIKNLGNKANLISVSGDVVAGSGKVSITMTAGNKARSEWGIKRVARAYEYGSGIHGKKKMTYPIRPRKKKLLAFFWEKFDAMQPDKQMYVAGSPKFAGFADDGRVLFRKVDHPGVEAVRNGKGYMKPAIDKVRRQVRKELAEIGKSELQLSIKRAFKK